jgi:tetratricopeptide (TPR) repeat protein
MSRTVRHAPRTVLLATVVGALGAGAWSSPAYAQAGSTQTASNHARGSSAAEAATRHVANGRRLYGELDFIAAIEALRSALEVPGAPDAVRLEALEYLGASYVVIEQAENARRAFLQMFELDPYHLVREPSGSPKIARFVENVRREVVDDAAFDPSVRLTARLPRVGRVGSPTPVRLTSTDGARFHEIRLFLRGQGEVDYASVRFEGITFTDGTLADEVMVPPRDAPDELELYLEARDRRGHLITRAGEPFFPLALPIRAGGGDGGVSIVERWWFWTTIGVVVAAGAVVAVWLTTLPDAPEGTLAPGRFQLP